jgi:hypothetical protein
LRIPILGSRAASYHSPTLERAGLRYLGGIRALFVSVHAAEWYISDVEHPFCLFPTRDSKNVVSGEGKIPYLSRGVAMVDDIEKSVSLHGFGNLDSEFSAPFGILCFGEVDHSQIGVVH